MLVQKIYFMKSGKVEVLDFLTLHDVVKMIVDPQINTCELCAQKILSVLPQALEGKMMKDKENAIYKRWIKHNE